MALALWLGSEVRIKVRVRVILRAWVIVLFYRNFVLFLVFYAFHIYIPQLCIVPFLITPTVSVALTHSISVAGSCERAEGTDES